MSTSALAVGSKVVVVKGCAARDVAKGTKAEVLSVTPMGADHGHFVKVVLSFPPTRMGFPSRVIAFYVRHENRLADATVAMNDGNPSHRIEVRAV